MNGVNLAEMDWMDRWMKWMWTLLRSCVCFEWCWLSLDVYYWSPCFGTPLLTISTVNSHTCAIYVEVIVHNCIAWQWWQCNLLVLFKLHSQVCAPLNNMFKQHIMMKFIGVRVFVSARACLCLCELVSVCTCWCLCVRVGVCACVLVSARAC